MMKHAHLLPHFFEGLVEAGCDEAGRGCLAGPVFAAAVILPEGYDNGELNDSKKIAPHRREELRKEIEHDALAWAVARVEPAEIDSINILNASIKAMHIALDKLSVRPQAIIVDGNRFKPYGDIPFQTIVKGDGKYQAIAAASILAKTHRDEYMDAIDSEFPEYDWKENKGYPTQKHRDAIARIGLSPYHRKTFRALSGAKKAK